MAFEQVAGGEWVGPVKKRHRQPTGLAKVIAFPGSNDVKARDLNPLNENVPSEGEALNELSMDFILSQRSLWKKNVETMGLTAAIEEYLRQTQLVSIKVEDQDEKKSRIRFIATKGLLVDKDQS